MRNIQVIDDAANANFGLFQATAEEFAALFPGERDIELAEDFHERVGGERARAILSPLWERPILKAEASGIHGTLFYGWADRREHLPASKREIDRDPSGLNSAQRRLFEARRGQ